VELDPHGVARVEVWCVHPASLAGVDLGQGTGVAVGIAVEALQAGRELDAQVSECFVQGRQRPQHALAPGPVGGR